MDTSERQRALRKLWIKESDNFNLESMLDRKAKDVWSDASMGCRGRGQGSHDWIAVNHTASG